MILVAQGRPDSARRALLEAVAGSEVVDRGFLRPSHAYCAMAAALVGDVAASEAHVRAAHDAQASYDGLFGVDLARAGAWLAAARGEVSAAGAAAQLVAEDAAGRGACALEVCALHDVVRFGRAGDVVDRLEALTTLVDGALVDVVAAHARALVDEDGSALDAASQTFSSLTFDLYAAEASAAAAPCTGVTAGVRARSPPSNAHVSSRPAASRRRRPPWSGSSNPKTSRHASGRSPTWRARTWRAGRSPNGSVSRRGLSTTCSGVSTRSSVYPVAKSWPQCSGGERPSGGRGRRGIVQHRRR